MGIQEEDLIVNSHCLYCVVLTILSLRAG